MNYIATKTNYFGITDRQAFNALIARTDAEDTIEVLERLDEPSKVALACRGCIYGLKDDDSWDASGFTSGLQNLLAPGDAIILQEVGPEGIRCVWGMAIIITRDAIEYLNLDEVAFGAARNMLGYEWSTTMDE